jgi:hypothetical protein
VKCTQCGYQNKPDADSCNLCHAVLKKARKEDRATSPTIKVAADRVHLSPQAPVPVVQTAPPPAAAAPGEKRHLLVRLGAPPIVLAPGINFTVGRQNSCTLAVPSNRVSRLHAEIRWDDGRPILSDKGSSNGTFVGGRRIKDHPLAPGDEVEIGPFMCVYQFTDAENPSHTPEDEFEGTQTFAGKMEIFTGQIDEAGIAEIVQGLAFNEKTGTLDVFGKEGDGWITVVKGAPCASESGGKTDVEAILALLALKQGRYTFSPEIENKEKRITTAFTAILLEFGRRQDERHRAKTTDEE